MVLVKGPARVKRGSKAMDLPRRAGAIKYLLSWAVRTPSMLGAALQLHQLINPKPPSKKKYKI